MLWLWPFIRDLEELINSGHHQTQTQTQLQMHGNLKVWRTMVKAIPTRSGSQVSNEYLKMTKKVFFYDAATLIYDSWPWKVNQLRALPLPMCVTNLRRIHPVVIYLSR